MVPLVEGAPTFLIAMFVVFPGPLVSIPYLTMALYLFFSRKPRRIDLVLVIICVMLLLILIPSPVSVVLVFFLPFVLFGTPFGLLLIPVLILALVVILRRRGKRKKAQKPTFAPTPFACPYCDRDLSTLLKDIIVCPYCGNSLPQRTCSSCGRDLSQFPTDIKNCPYCGKAVSTLEAEVTLFKIKPAKDEHPESTQRIRRYTKIAAVFGLLISVASLIIGPLLGGFLAGPGPNAPHMFPILQEYQSTLWNGVLAGILIAIISVAVRLAVCRKR
jgi:hypothetical protein